MRKNTGNLKIKNLKPLKDLFSSSYKQFLKIFLQWRAILSSKKILSKKCFDRLLDDNDHKS